MKFKAYKTAFGEIDPATVITDSDPVYLVLKIVDSCGHMEWEIKGRLNGIVVASSDQRYNLEISTY